MTQGKKTMIRISLMVMCCFAAACAQTGKKPLSMPPMPEQFDKAVQSLAQNLLEQIEKDRKIDKEKGKCVIVLDPFTDADSGEVPAVSRTIESILVKESEQHEDLSLTRLTTASLSVAEYIINGTIGLENLKSNETDMSQKYYHVSAKIRNLKKVRVIGGSDVWIADRDLDYAPTALYRDNPFFLKSWLSDDMNKSMTNKEYLTSLATRAILIEAGTAYEKGDYTKALSLFQTAARKQDGKIMQTYAGLYMTNHKLGNMAEAEDAFGHIVALSVEQYHTLSVKFLFAVNSDNFKSDADLREKYDTWLRQIGKYFAGTDHCVYILGHCSRTGSETWNNQLSFLRAKQIQKMLKPSFPDVMRRSKAIGMGFAKNIVGVGTDDNRDALDRRVEIKLVDCNELAQ